MPQWTSENITDSDATDKMIYLLYVNAENTNVNTFTKHFL
jgi:hypothetical protein